MFVSGCRTGAAPGGGLLPSFAESLVTAGAPCVIGWGHPVGDASATVLAGALYEQLGVGERVDVALARARHALLGAGSSDWHLLRAYADGSALGPLVSAPATAGRPLIRTRPAHLEFLDANAQRAVCPHDLFVGRRRLLQRCLRTLTTTNQADGAYAEGVLLHGMGGLGKSSAAARLCERLVGYRRLVWVGALDDIELARVVGETLGPAAAAVLNQPGADTRQRLRQLLDGLDHAVVFVLDDFERNVEGHDAGSPRFDAQGRAVLRPEALGVLGALLWAIRQSASPARVIVTSRYRISVPPGAVRLVEEALEALAGAELTKKTAHLESFSSGGASAEHRAAALRLADGNPRLLESLDRALGAEALDAETVLASLDAVAAEFRESVLAQALLAIQSAETARVLACLAVRRLPVDVAAVGAIAAAEVGDALARADAAGLVEAGVDAATGTPRYRVSALVAGLLDGVLAPQDRDDATDRAARHLWSAWWEAGGIDEPRALELLRLALEAGHVDHAVTVADSVTSSWIAQARFLEAAILAEQVLAHVEDHGVRHNLARAQEILGHSAALTNYQAALAACPPDDAERPAILHNMANFRAAQGEPEAAMDLYRQSLEIKERIGDARGKAATLANIGFIQAGAGETPSAMESLHQSASILATIGAWPDLATVLANLGAMASEDGVVYLAQVAWLASAVQVPITVALNAAGAIVSDVGPGDETALFVSLHALAVSQQASGHGQHEQILKAASGLVGACLHARGVEGEEANNWLAGRGLLDLGVIIVGLRTGVEAWVPEDRWMFERARFTSQ